MPTKLQKENAAQILAILKEIYPDPECALIHDGPWQLLCATILSAQCTDARVNIVTPALFKRFPTAMSMVAADIAEVEGLVKSTGFYHQKSLSLISMSEDVVERFGGVVPQSLEELTTLRGVGRKTANVLIGVAFGGDGMVVDTHVKRLSRLIGWTKQDDPVKIEQELMALHPKPEWTQLGHRLILHGRAICIANRPKCSECRIKVLCAYGKKK
ncbi:MAG: endonuclease III [Chthonomonadales bacterium]